MEILDLARPVLQFYQEWTVEEMLKDLARRCRVEGEEVRERPVGVPALQPVVTKPAGGSRGKDEDFDAAAEVEVISGLEVEEMASYLDRYTKKKLLAIGEVLNLKLPMKYRKDMMVTAIINHYEKRELADRMARRMPVDDKEFMEEMSRKLGRGTV